ncbi:hypothetical protein GCM10025773_39470 [Microbacterium jejuense]
MAGFQFALAVLVGAAALAIPGLLVAWTLRLRGLWLAAAAPVASFALVGLTSMGASWADVPWSIWSLLVATAVAVALAWGLRLLLRIPHVAPPRSGWRWASSVAIASGVVLMTLRTIRVIPGPDLFAQSFDNAFHLAAARFIVETGTASPWDVSALMRPAGDLFFYPSAWHALVALVAELSAVPITIASNAVLTVLVCAVWPIGAVLLARTIFGAQTPLLIAAGVLSAGFATYPFMLIASMGTYPLVASIALLPVAIAAAVELGGLGSQLTARRAAAVVLAAAAPALGAVHPSALVMLAVLTVPLAIIVTVRGIRQRPDRLRLIMLAAVLYVVLVVVAMLILRTQVVQPDSLRSSAAQALGEVALSSYGARQIPIVVAALTIVGIVVALMRRRTADWVSIGLWATVAAIYVATVAGDEFVRLIAGGPWYVDPNRIAAFTPVVGFPVAALGAAACWKWLRAWVRPRSRRRQLLSTVTLSVAAVAFAAAVIQSSSVRDVDTSLRAVFTPTDNVFTSLVGVGPNERELMETIPQTVSADEVIANNPRDGSGFIYPLTGRHLLTPYMLTDLDTDREVFYAGIADASPTDPACEVAQRLNIRWVVEFHPHQLLSGDTRFDEIKNIADSPNVELAKKVGDSALYRITGCGFGDE